MPHNSPKTPSYFIGCFNINPRNIETEPSLVHFHYDEWLDAKIASMTSSPPSIPWSPSDPLPWSFLAFEPFSSWDALPSLAFLFVSLILLCLLLSLTSPLPRGWLHPCLFLPLPSLLSLGLLLNFIFCLGEVPLLLSLHLLGRHCHLSPSWSSSSLLPSHLTALSRSWPFFPFLSPVLTSSE